MEDDGERSRSQMRRANVCIDHVGIATWLQLSSIELLVRELQDGIVRSEVLNQFDDTVMDLKSANGSFMVLALAHVFP